MKYNDNRDLVFEARDQRVRYPKLKALVKFFKKRHPVPLDVIDVGTRDGYTVELLNKYGYKAIGIELVDAYVKYAQEHKRNVVFGDLMDLDTLPKEKFDIVFSRHCLEHCRDGLQYFKSCEYLLKPKGLIFMVFPLETKEEFKKRINDGSNPCNP